MPDLDPLPIVIPRLQAVAALLALAHHEGIPVPDSLFLTGHANLEDLDFYATPDKFAAWSKWLNATPERDYPGSPYKAATATAQLDEWGPVSVCFRTRKDVAA